MEIYTKTIMVLLTYFQYEKIKDVPFFCLNHRSVIDRNLNTLVTPTAYMQTTSSPLIEHMIKNMRELVEIVKCTF